MANRKTQVSPELQDLMWAMNGCSFRSQLYDGAIRIVVPDVTRDGHALDRISDETLQILWAEFLASKADESLAPSASETDR